MHPAPNRVTGIYAADAGFTWVSRGPYGLSQGATAWVGGFPTRSQGIDDGPRWREPPGAESVTAARSVQPGQSSGPTTDSAASNSAPDAARFTAASISGAR